jgi:alanyl aminopeptidase
MNRLSVAGSAALLLLVLATCAQTPKVATFAPPSPSAAAVAAPSGKAAESAGNPTFRLPGDVRPTRESVELEVVPDREGFSGRVEIALELSQPRSELWISSRGLTLGEGTLNMGGERLPLTADADDAQGAARLRLPHPVSAGTAILSLTFRGSFDPHLSGLYRVKSVDRWYAFTQFEAVDARRAFPCFDEPAFKIPWDLTLIVPANLVAVANTNVLEETPSGAMKRLHFRTTRPLPSYLIALAVGDFDVVTPPPLPPNEVRSRPLQMRGIATKGRGGELKYALDAAGDMLVMLERWFGREFPYEKLDHVGTPDFAIGAMENAGLIIYPDKNLLVDPPTASEEQKLEVARVIAHETAHHWFGDLVTMAWWDDLWLNESFAKFMEGLMTTAWAKGSRYDLDLLWLVQRAMKTDEVSSVRPIRPDIKVERDIQGFDPLIVYPKGAQVIAMLEDFLGPDRFRAGIRAYIDAHADGNATAEDLTAALSTVGTDVRPTMGSFIEQPGIPLVRGALRCDGGNPKVTLKQSRNLPLGSPASSEARWDIPVCVRTELSGDRHPCLLLRKAEDELPLPQKRCPAWIALNPGAHGYYRWTLPPVQLKALRTRGYRSLTPAERMSLGSNLFAALRSGALPAADVLAALGPLARDPEPAVSREPVPLLKFVREHLVEPGQRSAVEAHMRSLHGPVLARMGWTPKPGEPARVQAFRPWLIDYLAFDAQDRTALERAATLGRAYLGTDGRLHPEAVDPNLVPVAVAAAARTGSTEVFETMVQRLRATEDSNARRVLLDGLAHFPDPDLAERARWVSMEKGVRASEVGIVAAYQAFRMPELRPGAWAWFKAHFEEVAPRLPRNIPQLIANVQQGCTEDEATELEQALGSRLEPYPGGLYTLAKAVEETRVCAAVVARQRQSATEFFRSKRGGALTSTATPH